MTSSPLIPQIQIPRLQTVFSTYCSRHERATERLQELEADADFKTYLDNCKALSAGRTNAWDIHSLLIKPVQRALKCVWLQAKWRYS